LIGEEKAGYFSLARIGKYLDMERIRQQIWNGQSHVRPSRLPLYPLSVALHRGLSSWKRAKKSLVFSKTLFTPAGIDIYIRSVPGKTTSPTTEERQVLLDKVIGAVQGSSERVIAELAKGGFQVPGVV
jgi:hypothetical protein